MKATIKTLTPVHIGNGITYNKNIDFIQAGNKIGIIDENKVLQFIGEKNINQWIAAIERGGNEFISLLKGRGFSDPDLEKISLRICSLETPDHQSTQLKENYRTAITGVTIPGSSLKGSIKTALFDDLTSRQGFKFDIEEIRFPKYNKRSDRNIDEWKDTKVEKRLFGDNANEKSTRFLKIGDISFPDCETEVHEVRILNIENGEWVFKSGQHFLAETIPSNAKADFTFSIDELLLKRNIQKYPELWPDIKIEALNQGYPSICKRINDFTASLIEWEFDLLEKEDFPEEGSEMLNSYEKVLGEIENCKENEFIIRVGANSGWIFMTGGWWRRFADDITDEDFSSLRKVIQKKNYYDMDLWPKTRKISSSGQIFGFVKVSLHNQ